MHRSNSSGLPERVTTWIYLLCLPPLRALSTVDLGTLGGLNEHEHSFAAYCAVYEPWATLPAQGQGSRRLPIAVRCRDCGELGQVQVRQPVPRRAM